MTARNIYRNVWEDSTMSNYMTHKATRAGRAETLRRREVRRIKQNGWAL